ncbi:MAG: DNA polymerase III subunit alpha, partial [Microbacteriaceae bacterium]|nr:DNA polymerase III subunit alpha [Microbacteriaceae bacterium]
GMITLEDFSGEVTLMFMGKVYQEFASILVGDSLLVARGRVSRRDDGLNLHAQAAFVPDVGSMDAAGPLTLSVPDHRATEHTMGELAQVLQRHSGDTEVRLRLYKGQMAKVFEVPMPVRLTADLYGDLKGLLGPQCLS